jgi:hypothetical protein
MTLVLLLSATLLASAAPADLAPPTPTVAAAQDQMPVRLIDGQLRLDPIYVGLGDPIAPAYCIADCAPHVDVDCTGSTCTGVDRNCAVGQRGYVQCDQEAKIWCPSCDPDPPGTECTDGEWDIVQTGSCCGSRTSWKEFYQCQNGYWVLTGTNCTPDPSCPI